MSDDGGPPVRRLADWDADRLRRLATEYGTPLYVLDLDRVDQNAHRLIEVFGASSVSYAVKANAARPVLATLAAAGLGAECASAGEVQRALDAGFPPGRVRYTAVNPPAGDLDHVVGLATDRDLVVTVGAADTVDRLVERGYGGRLCVRVNPGVGAGHHDKVTTGDAPQFGVPIDRVAGLVESLVDRGLDVEGLHAHAGSGILSAEDLTAHRELVSRMGDLARRVERESGLDLTFLNVGGGLGVPARPEEDPLDLATFAEVTRRAAGDIDARVDVEPGRYLVADAGVLLTKVNTIKETPETTVIGVDAGMNTLLRPAMYGAYHDVRSLSPDAGDRDAVRATVAGPICETADVLAADRSLPEPERDDVLAVGTTGAYGYEMASQYNSRPRPARVVLTGSGARVATRRETIPDLTRLEQSW